jgi:DHA2 family multidrug resistance protein-like MFS transporter
MGINSLIVATSLAVGPSVAAGILSVANWPWLFAVNLPFGALALALVGALPRTETSGHRFDFASAAMNAVLFALFIAAIDGVAQGESAVAVVSQFAAVAAVGYVFVRRQLLLPAPLLPVDLLRRPVFALTVAAAVCSFIAQTSANVALPFLFELGFGRSQAATGLMMTAWPLTVMLVAPLAGRWSDRVHAGTLGGIGLAVQSVGLVLLLFLPADPPGWQVAWRLALCGAGSALFQAPNSRLMILSAPRERSGAGSGMLSTSRLLGQTTGAALVAVLFDLADAGDVAQGTRAALVLAIGASVLGAACSSARLRH